MAGFGVPGGRRVPSEQHGCSVLSTGPAVYLQPEMLRRIDYRHSLFTKPFSRQSLARKAREVLDAPARLASRTVR